jgi:hypothetical protein
MENIDFDELRELIEKRFLNWYENKPKERFEPKTFDGNLRSSNLENYDYLVESFNDVLRKDRTVGASTFRKLFYYQKTNFHLSTIKHFSDYIDDEKAEKKNFSCSDILNKGYEKWIVSKSNSIITHHYFLTADKYREIAPEAYSNLTEIKQELKVFLMINAIKHGDCYLYLLIEPCFHDKMLIQYLTRLLCYEWIRVTWRAAFVLSMLNDSLVNESLLIYGNQDLLDSEKELIDHIYLKQVDIYLEKISKSNSDLNDRHYAIQVLKFIRCVKNMIKRNSLLK